MPVSLWVEFLGRLTQLGGLAASFTPRQAELLLHHYELLLRWNRQMNLTRITDLADAMERHYGESLLAAGMIPAGIRSVADIGSGAGFPGIPMAVARPEVVFHLVESVKKKAAFLREASEGIPNVRVVCDRAEAFETPVDLVCSRAVRPSEVVGLIPGVSARALLFIGRRDLAALLELPGMRATDVREVSGSQDRVVALVEYAG